MTQTNAVVTPPDPVVTPRSLFFALERFESLNVEDQLPLLALMLGEELSTGDLSQVLPNVRVDQQAPQPLSLSHDRLVVEEVAAVGTVVADLRDSNTALDERRSREANGPLDALITPTDFAPRRTTARPGATTRTAGTSRAGYVMAVANAKVVSIVTVMAISFSLTAGFLLWQNKLVWPKKHAVAPTAATTNRVAAGSSFSNLAAVDRSREPPTLARAPAAPAAAHPGEVGAHANGVTATGSVASQPPADDEAAAELPIELHFRHLQGKVQGSALSTSNEDLVVTASIVNSRTKETAEIQLAVAAYKAQTFGLNEGVDLESGDQITLKSSPYRDRVVVVP
jgi:hypothetical protein